MAAGAGGEDLDSLEAIAATFVDLAPQIQLPEPEMALPLTAPVIDIPQVRLPDPVLLPPEPPKITPPKRAEEKPKPPPPKPKPEPRPRAEKKTSRRNPRRCKAKAAPPRARRDRGAGAQAGTGGTDAQATVSAGTTKSLLAKWGATIRTRIERRKAIPPRRDGLQARSGWR
ncbi:hypothetical protein ACTTAM_06210 [Rhodobacter capsulatus]|uniref:hypothetical protein n=1 Tax=Rhodobacter capsulatus TaxID=1061 RepID=UPI00402A589B